MGLHFTNENKPFQAPLIPSLPASVCTALACLFDNRSRIPENNGHIFWNILLKAKQFNHGTEFFTSSSSDFTGRKKRKHSSNCQCRNLFRKRGNTLRQYRSAPLWR